MASVYRSKNTGKRLKECPYSDYSYCNIKGITIITIMIIALFCLSFVSQTFALSTESYSTFGTNSESHYQTTNANNKNKIGLQMSDEPPYQMAYACENEMLKINCTNMGLERSGSGKRNLISLEIIRANFGRFSISICNNEGRSDISVNCQSHSSLEVMKNVCKIQRPNGICSVLADPEIFLKNDPCPDTPKYLEVQYNCVYKKNIDKSETSKLGEKSLQTLTIKDKLHDSERTYEEEYKKRKRVTKRINLNNLTKKGILLYTPTISPTHHLSTTTTPNYNTKLRIPITVVPHYNKKKKAVSSHSTFSSAKKSFQKEVTNANKTKKNKHGDTTDTKVKEINFITTKFLSSSVASTNIMDTSELPVSKFSDHKEIEDHSLLPSSHDDQIVNNNSHFSNKDKINARKQKEYTQIDVPYVNNNVESTLIPINNLFSSSSRILPSSIVTMPNIKKNTNTHSDKGFNSTKFKLQESLESSSKPLIETSTKRMHSSSPIVSNETLSTIGSSRSNHKTYNNKDNENILVPTYKFCQPNTFGNLYWNETKSNTRATMRCPKYSSGFAYRFCDLNGNWEENSADLSQCTSEWLNKIILDLEKRDQKLSVVHLSNIMAEYVTRNHFHGGDISHLINTMEKLVDALRLDLELIPTSSQRKAVITQVVQNIIKTGSVMIDLDNHFIWRDVGQVQEQLETVSALVMCLENAGLLLPEGAGENKEVTIASENILLSAKKVSFRHMRGTTFPSVAATASRYWLDYEDRIEIPSMDLMKNMEITGASHFILLAFKNIDVLMEELNKRSEKSEHIHSKVIKLSGEEQLVINSQLISFSFGTLEKRMHPNQNFKHLLDLKNKNSNSIPLLHAISENHSRLSVPITIHFKHKLNHTIPTTDDETYPLCVYWDHHSHNWNANDCGLLMTNKSHSTCACQKLGTYALLVNPSNLEGTTLNLKRDVYSATVITIIVSSSILILLSILLIAVGFVYCGHVQRATAAKSSSLSLAGDSSHKRLQEESSPSHVNFLLNGGNILNYPEQPIYQTNSKDKTKTKPKIKHWLSSLIQDTLRCNPCHIKKNSNTQKRNRFSKSYTTDSSYTFQRTPKTSSHQVHEQIVRPDLIIDDEPNTIMNNMVVERTPIPPRGIDFSSKSNTLHQQHISPSLRQNVVEFATMNFRPSNMEVSRTPNNHHRSISSHPNSTMKIHNASNPHIYAEVQEVSYHGNPNPITNWQMQDLHHPLCQSTLDNEPQSVQQMGSEPIRQPLIVHQKYLSQLNTNNSGQNYCPSTLKPNERDNIHPSSSPQDCSMSSYSSSGYDSMTQSPPSSSRVHETSQHQQQPLQHYSTNYDNVRGHLRGPFVSYTNNRN